MKKMTMLALATALGASATMPASATMIVGANALPGGNAINLPAVNQAGSGPITLDGMTWSSNMETSRFGSTGGYTFGNGTVAPGGQPMLLLDAGSNNGAYASMKLVFPTLTSGFLGEFFWSDGTSASASVNIAAFDSNGNMVEQIFLNNNGLSIGNPAGYYGFSRTQADVAYVWLSNGYIGARNLSWMGREINSNIVGAIPEPSTWTLLIAGFAAIGAGVRRRKRMSLHLV